MQRRVRSKAYSFEDRIAAEKARTEGQLAATPQGPQHDALATKVRQLDTASHINDWLRSPGLQSPR
ncbi:hypothetical protein V1286_001145 [Bradyrhizobium algeriense]|uniref:Transposase n=1 Tax=Bradyrhizobium algeriense TaxID=634784 RepID=A0ABU8B511_9BRAD